MVLRGNGAIGANRAARERLIRTALLGTTALVGITLASPAMAQQTTGGNGGTSDGANVANSVPGGSGSGSGVAGANGTGYPGNGTAFDGSGGGGGGAGAAGGSGGSGFDVAFYPATAGGAAGAPGQAGGNGAAGTGNASVVGYGAGGGGGGGGGTALTTSGVVTITQNQIGGAGGRGGDSVQGGGGGGGAGGNGIEATGAAMVTVNAGVTVRGGAGGGGGNTQSFSQGGQGGGGGVGYFGSGSLFNAGTIATGAAGASGTGPFVASAAAPGSAAVLGSNLSVTNTGSIVGNGVGDSISYTSGVNALTLSSGGTTGTLIGNIGITGSLAISTGAGGASTTLANIIHDAAGGPGSVAVNSGNLVLTGANSWTGTTTVNANTSLTGTAASIAGSSIVNNSGSLSLTYQDTAAATIAQNISGTGGINIASAAALTFSGSLTTLDSLVLNNIGSNVTLSGTRSGGTNAAFNIAGTLNIANTGSVLGGNYNAVVALNTATVNNLGDISTTGTSANSGFASFVNAPGSAIAAANRLTVNNGSLANATASIVGVTNGISSSGTAPLTVVNYGAIVGNDAGIIGAGTGAINITNNVGGLIGTGTLAGGVFTPGGTGFGISLTGGTVTNRGMINSAGAGIRQTSAAGQLTLVNSGSIFTTANSAADPRDAIFVTGTANILNSGSISSSLFYGLNLNNGGTVTNAAGGSIAGGTQSNRAAIFSTGAATNINNYGSLTSAVGLGIQIGGSSANSINLFAGSNTDTVTGGGGNDVLAIYNGRGTLGAATVDAASGITLQNAGTLAAATVGPVDLGGGTDTIVLRGTGDGTAANGATGSFSLAGLNGIEILTKADSGTWNLTAAAVNPGVTINAGTGGAPGSGGLLIFNGTTGLTGTINVNGGTIRANTAGAFGSGTINAIDPTIQYAATGTYSNPIVLSSTNTAADPTRLEVGNGFTATLSGLISQTLAPQPLVFGLIPGATSGTTVLTNGSNAWTGATTIEAGVTLRGTAQTISGGSIVDNGILNYNQSGVGIVDKAISGSGSLLVNGGGTIALFNTGTFTGGTTVDGSTLQVGDSGANGSITGPITLANNALLTFSRTGNPVITSAISGDGNVRTVSSTITLNGNISNTGTLYEDSTGNVTLGGIRSGATTASDGGYGSGFLLSGTNGQLTVASTGQIQGGQYIGVRVTGQGASVTNSGTISNIGTGGNDQVGAGVAIYTVGGTNSVTNSGTITGQNNAINQRGSATTALTINNSGSLISNGYSAFESSGSAGVVTVSNTGANGTIYAQNTGFGLNVNSAAGLTLTTNTGRIVGRDGGINSAGAVNITNAGLIGAGQLTGLPLTTFTAGGNANGINASNGGTITNNTGGMIVGGTSGNTSGIQSSGAGLTVNNSATIIGQTGINSLNSGLVPATAFSLLVNNLAGGSITGRFGSGIYADRSASITNAGLITTSGPGVATLQLSSTGNLVN